MILAMWSGPRNLSTAMMRSFANRRDVMNVMDEPLYASYLFRSPKRHPMHDEILKSQPTSYKEAINNCLKESSGISFQKHMVQHVNFDESNLDAMDIDGNVQLECVIDYIYTNRNIQSICPRWNITNTCIISVFSG